MDFSNYEKTELGIDFNKIINDPLSKDITKKIANKISEVQYLTPGDFLCWLSDSDLQELTDIFESSKNNENDLMAAITMAEILVMAEGIPRTSLADCPTHVKYFMILVNAEVLARKGILEIDYPFVSLGNDISNTDFIKYKKI